MDFHKANDIQWMDDDALQEQSTSIPEVVIENTTHIGTLIIFVISAILTITILFVIAIFIDCRQQKLAQLQPKKRKRIVRLKIPKIGRPVREDEHTIVDRMQQEPSTSTDVIV